MKRKEVKPVFWQILGAIRSLLFAAPSQVNPRSIGIVAGEGGWDLEDSNHYRKK